MQRWSFLLVLVLMLSQACSPSDSSARPERSDIPCDLDAAMLMYAVKSGLEVECIGESHFRATINGQTLTGEREEVETQVWAIKSEILRDELDIWAKAELECMSKPDHAAMYRCLSRLPD